MKPGREWDGSQYRELLPEEILGDVLATAVDAMLTVAEDGVILDVVASETLGYSSEQLAGLSIGSLYATDASPSPLFDVTSAEAFERAVLDGTTAAVTAPLEAADGHVVPMQLSTVSRTDTSGFICVGHDVSDHIAAVRDDSQTALLDTIPDPLYVLDSEGRVERVNDALVEYTGYERGELLGREMADILPASAYAHATSTVLELVDDEDRTSETFETAFLTKEGERLITEAHIAPFTDADGTYAGAIGVLRDIRERKHRERNLDLLKQVLTRVFRHNVRNELMIAKGHADLLDDEIDEDLREHTAQILETADRLLAHSEKARLIEGVIETEDRYELDIPEIVDEVVDSARKTYPEATIDVDLPETATVEAHPDIARAIEELLENAIEHASDGEAAHVDIWLDQRGDTQTLFVEDESGGLADHEVDVLQRGAEHDLEHSSGVGLWLIRWLVEYSDAEMIVHRTDEGSLMGIRFGQRATAVTDTADDMVSADDIADSPLARAPAHVRDISPERFRGDTVIGRVDALDQLDAIYESLEHTGGHSVLVTGEAGVGKTTLIEQFRDRLARREGMPVTVTGMCSSETQLSYHAFRQVMDDIPGERGLSEILADAASFSTDDADELQQHKRNLFADIADVLRTVSLDQPVVLFIEDMQWADQSTIDLFEYLVDEVGRWGNRVMFVGTYRTSDIDQTHPVLEIAEETAAAGRGTVIELEPFEQRDVRALISHMFDIDEIPSSFVEAVHDHTGGTPLFVNELGRHLVDTLGPIQSGDDLPESFDDVSVPETVESAITERLDGLPDAVAPVLHVGAVLGREFSFDLLREASERPVDVLIENSNTLVRRQVWTQSADGIEFLHGVVREQTLDTIPSDERETLHATVADAIETVHADALDEYAGRLAAHYEQVGEYDTAFEYYRQAGDYAAESYGNQTAVDHYTQALALAREHGVADDSTAAHVATELGAVFELLGEYSRAREYFEDSRTICETAGDREGLAECLRNIGKIDYRQGMYDEAKESLQRSLDICQERGDKQGEADCLNYLGSLAARQGNSETAHDYFERALAIGRETDDRQLEAECLNNLGILADTGGDHDSAREYYEESLDIYREIDDRKGEALSLNNLALLAKAEGEYGRARDHLEASLEARQEIGDRHGEATSLHNLGSIARARDEYDQAQEYYEQSLAIEREIGHRQGEARSVNALGIIARIRGEYERAEEYVEEGLAIAREIGDRRGEANSLNQLGNLVFHRGEYERAAEYAEGSLGIAREIGDRQGEAESLCSIGRFASKRGEHDRARETLTDALDIARDVGVVEPELICLHELGAVARRQGAYDEAAQYLSESLSVCDVAKNGWKRAQIHLEQTRLALARGETETARETLENATDILTDLTAAHGEARATLLAGRIAAMDDEPEDARDHWVQALDAFEGIGAPQDALTTLRYLVDSCERQGEDAQAADYRERARAVFADAPDPVRANHEWLDP